MSRTSVTWGIRRSVSAAEKDGERGGRFPTVRHEHLLGLIGRSNFSSQAQAEESEDRRRLVWDRGNTIFTSSAKRKAKSPRASGRSFIAYIAFSRRGSIMAQHYGVKAGNDRQAMSSKSFAVFVASLHYTNDVKVMPSGTPRSLPQEGFNDWHLPQTKGWGSVSI